MVQESVISLITLALLHKFVYEFRGNNTYVIQEKTSLAVLNTVEFREVGRNASNVEMRKEKRRRLLR